MNVMLLTNKKGRPGTKITPVGLVMHWTANTGKGANAKANRNYFNSGVSASAHYIVDSEEILQCVPENEMAYHVGAKKYKTNKFGSYPNSKLIGIEMCVNIDGVWSRTYANSVKLAADILKRHKWTVANLYRHYDITGKDCPKMMIDDKQWDKFKFDVQKEIGPDIKVGTIKEMKPVIDYLGRWSEANIKRAIQLGIMQGYPDGSFKPAKNVTREELATALVNLHDGIVKEITTAIKK